MLLSPATRLVQNAWVVPRLEPAIEGWLALGVGPFFILERDYPDALYRGAPVPLSFRAALAQAGDIQIELIEQTSDGPSAYRDVVPVGETGFHHMCKITDDFDGDTARLRAAGIAMASELVSDGIPTCYADTRAQMGCMLELLPPAPILLQVYAIVAQAADGWTGTDPVRDMVAALSA